MPGSRRRIDVLAAVCMTAISCSRTATVGFLPDDARDGDGGALPVDGGQSPDPTQISDDAPLPVAGRDDCQPGTTTTLSSSDVAALTIGPARSDAGMRWLYPYDETVFPAQAGAPLLMWEGPVPEAVLIRLYTSKTSYIGCFRADATRRLPLPPRAWSDAEAAGGAEPFTLELKSLANGIVTGPIRLRLTIAPASLGASLYFMSYGSATTNNRAASALLRLRPGTTLENAVTMASCAGCHAIAADGASLLAHVNGVGASFDLKSTAAPVPSPAAPLLHGAELAALAADGATYVAPAHPLGFGPRALGPAPNLDAALIDAQTGASIADSGIPRQATVPAFSADGSLLAFNDAAVSAGRGLSLMAFSIAGRRATDYRQIFADASGYPGWPTFFPGARALAFALGDRADMSSGGAGFRLPTSNPALSDLYALRVGGAAIADRSGVALLARAVGFATQRDAQTDATYLPFGREDLHHNYHPAFSPRPSGGYYWLFFDSLRHYGNYGLIRQIWGTAVDAAFDGRPGADGSHPAFYVSGQETGAVNLRPIVAVD